ncbi:Rho GTPase activation protein [Cladochytrium replicatum]|nr:Rho GTPase activation protein [Cladochytrium replicatum]
MTASPNVPQIPQDREIDTSIKTVESRNANNTPNLAIVPTAIQAFALYLDEKALDLEGIFRLAGSAKTVRELRTHVERVGKIDFSDAPEHDMYSVAALFKQFLRELADGVVQAEYVKSLLAAKGDIHRIHVITSKLHPINYHTLIFLIEFLRKVSEMSFINKMTSQNLCIIFAPNIFRCPSAEKVGDPALVTETGQMVEVMNLMMENFDEIFFDKHGGEGEEETTPKLLEESPE